MADLNLTAYGTVNNYLTTELNSLADGANDLGAAINNSTALDLFIDIEISLASLTPTTGGYIQVYKIISVDGGTTYQDGGDSIDPPAGTYFKVAATRAATAAQVLIIPEFKLSPGYQKLLIRNECGVAFAASGNTVDLYPWNYQTV